MQVYKRVGVTKGGWLLLALLFVIGCQSGKTQGPLQLVDADNGKDVSLASGQTLTVALQGNPTTGYTWEVAEVDTSVLQRVGDITFKADSTLIGAGGVQTATFTAVKKGTTVLTLIYHRPFEADVAPIKTFSVQVAVK